LARLGRVERARAAEHAYSINPLAGLDVHSRVLIVDDVITTGATAAACAETLQSAGPECLGIVSFARADPLAEHA
jgi:predicted amidophosphoribosyltransferase